MNTFDALQASGDWFALCFLAELAAFYLGFRLVKES